MKFVIVSIGNYNAMGGDIMNKIYCYIQLLFLIANFGPVGAMSTAGQLLQAAEWGNVQTIQQLVRARADINVANGKGLTPLMLAAKNGFLDTVRAVLDLGADTSLQDLAGTTALMYAVYSSNADLVRLLIGSSDRAVNASNNCGSTALFWAACKGDCEQVKLLIDAQADLDTRNSYGSTALTAAVQNGNALVVRELLSAGASIIAHHNYAAAIDSTLGYNDVRTMLDNHEGDIRARAHQLVHAASCQSAIRAVARAAVVNSYYESIEMVLSAGHIDFLLGLTLSQTSPGFEYIQKMRRTALILCVLRSLEPSCILGLLPNELLFIILGFVGISE
jgi:hypothetical protein